MYQKENQDFSQLVLELQKQLIKSNELLDDISLELYQIREELTNLPSTPQILKDWMPREATKKLLGYADTQFAAITKEYKLVYTMIGKKKLFHIPSLDKILHDNIVN